MHPNAVPIRRALLQCAITLTILPLLAAPHMARADTISGSDPACPSTGTFATLEALGTCSIGDKSYNNFVFQSGMVTSGDLNYLTVNNGNIANGFLFQIANFFATGSETTDMTLGFDVTAPTATITSEQLTQVGSTFDGGIASIGEVVCLGGPVIGCPAADTKSLMTISTGNLSANLSFGAVREVGVSKDLSAIADGGFASISAFSETVDQITSTPEPSFYGVLTGALALVFTFSKRRKKTV
jgi:hypothetical protein